MSTIYEKMGLRRIINASGHMTKLGVSTISDEVGASMVEAAQNFVVIDDLIDRVGELLSRYTGAEDSCVTSCASAGIMMAVAAVIAGDNLALIERMPDSRGLKNEILLQKGHAVNFGASEEQMIRLGGGVPVEAGQCNQTFPEHLEDMVNENTAALFYCISHHVHQESGVSLEDTIRIAHAHGLPVIVDAAAEEDTRKYVAMGADLVIYSGAKAFEGCTSGLITGKKDLIAKCKLQYKGVGRAGKVGKENMVGLVKALELYDARDEHKEAERQKAILNELLEGLSGLDYIKTGIMADDAGRRIYRARLDVVPGKSRYTARELVHELENGSPAIYTRNHSVDSGTILLDPRTMLPGDAERIIKRLKELQ